jgi:hypothetical protein
MSAYATAVEDQLNDRLVALRAEALPPRRDRTFFTNLEISRAHAERFRTDADAMRAKARELIPRIRSNTRGGALDHLVEWEALLAGPDADVIAMLTREDQHGAEMRVSSPFAGILTDTERRAALECAWAQLDVERSR